MLTRRRFLADSALALAAARIAGAQSSAASPVVRTSLGELRGTAEGGVHVFRGVPFAQPPTGALRFLPSRSAEPWTGVRAATSFAPAAVQPGEASVPQSEDCLYLNVWAPPAGGPYPVFVWIHGGGFTGGNAFDPLFDGTRFASEGIVCVTVAYRLGVLGFLDLGQPLGAPYAGGANHALGDLAAALRWVQANIGAFGGDPHRVTIGGESAGAKLTGLLMGAPAAQGLFQQMISESGGAERVYPVTQSAVVAEGFVKEWTARTGQPARALLTAPAKQLIDVQQAFTRSWPAHFPLRAEIDGTFLPRPPLDTLRTGNTHGKRLLIGTNRDESALFLGPHPSRDPGAGDLGNMSVAQFRPLEARYAALYPEMTEEERRIRSVTAEEYWIPSTRVAEAHVHGGGTAFAYLLDFPAPRGRWKGYAFHSYDLRFVWEHFGADDTPTSEELRLAETMHAAWSAFIREGHPVAAGLPEWPAYTEARRETMLLDAAPHVEADPQGRERQAWDGLLQR